MNKFLHHSLRVFIVLTFLLPGVLVYAQSPDANGIVYVTENGNGNGFNWNNATSNLQGAINATGVTKVFVAVGNYPSPPNGFVMKNNVAIYGGFNPGAGIKTLADNRVLPTASIGGSVLSGENTRRVINNYNGSNLDNTAVLDGFTVTNGYAQNTNGAGIYNFWSSPSFYNLVIKGNVAGGGAGVSNLYSNATFTNIELINNTAQDASGGGMSNNNGSPVLTNVTFSNNTAYLYGGGLQNGYGCSPILTNVKIINNIANDGGGAINTEAAGGTTTLTNVTIANNSSPAINILGGSIDIRNSIVYGGIVGINSLQYSLVEGYNSTANGNINSTSVSLTDIFTNPSTGDYTLKAGSPAINAGNNALYSGLNVNTQDLKGDARLMGTTIDLGIYERFAMTADNGIIYVKPIATGSTTGNSWANATSDLQGAINTNGVSKVFVAIGNYNAPANSFVMKNGVEIYGGFDPVNGITTLAHNRVMPNPANTQGSVLNGENARTVINNNHTLSNPLNNSAVLDGFTIMNGQATDGAGIYNMVAAPTLRNLVVRNNKAMGKGGGMFNDNGSPMIINAVICNNEAKYGGGIISALTIDQIILTNVTVVNNIATSEGGGIYCGGLSKTKIYNSIIWNNTQNGSATASGADIKLYNATSFAVQNSLSQNYSSGNASDGNIEGTDPMFVNLLGSNYALKSNSPAVGKGNNAWFSGLNANSKDVIGNARVYNYANSGVIDMGAIESPYTTIVPTSGIAYVRTLAYGKQDGSSWDDANNILQNAINGTGVQKVFLATGNYNVGDNSFIMKNGVEIYGGFDPANNIKTLNDNRIMPDASDNSLGSVLNGQNTRPVIWNYNNGLNATAVLDGVYIANGSYTNGGGIVNVGSSPTYRNLVIRGNKATVTGGGMYNFGSSPLIINTVFRSNTVSSTTGTAVYGGAIYNANTSAPVLTNVNIVGNVVSSSGTEGGAGIYNDNSSPKIYNSILWNNIKQYAGGTTTAGADIQSSEGALTLKNSITQSYTTGNTADNNLAGINPLFVDVSNGNYKLQISSPAIGAGNNALYAGLNVNTTDLAGNLRLSGDVIDMGVYEYQLNITPTAGIVYVKPTASGNGNGSSWTNATNFLQDAINTTGIQKVYVATGNYNTGSSSFVMKNNVEIYGGFNPVNNTTDWNTRTLPNEGTGDGSVLNGQNTRAVIYNAFTSGARLDGTAILDGFTITNGKTSGSGSGIYNAYASPTLRNLAIRNNTAGTAGGGVYNNSSSAINLSNAIIKDNTAAYGGGIYNNGSAAVLTNVNITGNKATMATDGAGGGGIFNQNAALKLTNVAITGNNSSSKGGAFRNLSGNPVFTNVTFANNTADINYDAMDIQGGIPELNNSIVFGAISGTYNPKSSLIQNNTDLTNGNTDATNITAEAIFADPVNGDYTLLGTSSAVNAGNNTLYTGLDANTTDLAGNARLYGATIDLGAYEYQSVITAYMTGTDLNNRIVLYPNPTREHVTISGLSGDETIYFYDATGSMMKQVKCNGQQINISLDNLNQGIYHIEIVSDNGNRTVRKLMKP